MDLEAVRGALRDYGVLVALLFGSHITGTARAGSDVDLAVWADRPVDDWRLRGALPDDVGSASVSSPCRARSLQGVEHAGGHLLQPRLDRARFDLGAQPTFQPAPLPADDLTGSARLEHPDVDGGHEEQRAADRVPGWEAR
ncbi:MAG: nucleotidyltransferase domain-containing protein [Euzebyales bacterium]|nr:nucleotidyltransferase domain-containing protein [Euzebyales bacterium]